MGGGFAGSFPSNGAVLALFAREVRKMACDVRAISWLHRATTDPTLDYRVVGNLRGDNHRPIYLSTKWHTYPETPS